MSCVSEEVETMLLFLLTVSSVGPQENVTRFTMFR